jgi:hypothetical protein
MVSIGAKKEKQLQENLSQLLRECAGIAFTVSKWK